MQILYSFDIKQYLIAGVINLNELKKIIEQAITTENMYLNLLNNNNVNGIQLFVLNDGAGSLKICAQTNYSKDTQFNISLESDDSELVETQIRKSELQLQNDYGNYVRQIESGEKPAFNRSFINVMGCIKKLDNLNCLSVGNECIDHTIVAISRELSDPPLIGDGVAESFQLSDLSFIIKPNSIKNVNFKKIRVKATVEKSFHVIRERCGGRGVHGRYRLEKVGSSYQLVEFEFIEPPLLREQ